MKKQNFKSLILSALAGMYGIGADNRNKEGQNHEIIFQNNTVKGNIKLAADQKTNSYGSKATNIDDPSRTDTHYVGIRRYSVIGDTNHIQHGETLNSVGGNAHLEGTYNVTVISA